MRALFFPTSTSFDVITLSLITYLNIHYSSEISEESELQLTTKMNEVIKQRWVALGPRNYGKSIEWKLEGEPWDTEGLYADHTRGVYLLCLLLEAIQPLGWRLVSSAGEIRKVQIMLFINFILKSVHNYKECFSAEVRYIV